MELAEFEVSVVDGKLLDFDFLVGMDAIKSLDFNTDFDPHHESGKMIGRQTTWRTEYPSNMREDYDREKQLWLDNGWLLPCPERELDQTRC